MPERMSARQRAMTTTAAMRRPYEGKHDVVNECRLRCYESWAASQTFRLQREDDREFMRDQYYEEDRAARESAGRASLQIHTVNQRIQSVLEDFRRAEVGFRVGAAAGGAGYEVAAIYNGLAQADMRDVRSQAAMAVAAQECVSYGAAYLQWMAVPVSPRNPFDKRLILRAAANDRVYEDPKDDTREKSNMSWLVEVDRISLEQRNAMWPDAEGIEPTQFQSVSGQDDWWFPESSLGPEQDRECRIAYYYRRLWEEKEFVIAPGWATPLRVDQMPPEQVAELKAAGAQFTRSNVPYIEFSVVDGAVPLVKPTRLPYTRIPYCRLVGQVEISETEEEIPRGIVYYLKDQSRYMSLVVSDMLEKQVLNSADFWVVANEGDAGAFDETRSPGTRYYNAFHPAPGPDGTPVPVPAPFYHTSNPAIEASMGVVGMLRELQSVSSGAADAPMREETARVSSVQVLDRQDRMQAVGRRTYVWWYSSVTMQAAAEIWLDMSVPTYGREGRIVRVAGEGPTDADQGAIIGVPFYRDDDGVPIAVPEAMPGVDSIPHPDNPQDPETAYRIIRFSPDRDKVKLTTYAGITETGAADAALELATNVAATSPALGPALAPAIVKGIVHRFPGMSDALDRVEAAFPSPVGKHMSAKDAVKLVVQLRAQLDQANQQLQVAQQAADQVSAAKEIESIRAEARQAAAQITAAAGEVKAQIEANTKMALALGERAHEKAMQEDSQEHDAAMKGIDIGSKQADAAGRGGGQ